MIYALIVIVVAAVIIGAVVIRRKTNQRGINYAPDPNLRSGGGRQVGVRPGPGAIPVVGVPTPEFKTEEIARDEFNSDVPDDLLDPRNPRHAEWLKEHPEMASDKEWVAEHPEDNPS
jgi:hypothetical protein